ncbi:MAG: MobH family relaxase [Pseudomonadota bacterium]
MALPLPSGTAYPSADPGIGATPVEDLLASNDDLIGRIRLCFGIDRASFERDVLTLIQRYAACVHLLPATADNYFAASGGLLRLGLEVAFFSLQGTDAHILAGQATISARQQLEPRWRQATFIAGLCCELHRVLSHIIVTDDAGDEWPAYLQPLASWLQVRDAQRYFVRWRLNAIESRSLGVFALPHVVPPGVLQSLNEHNAVIVSHLMASIGGVPVYRDHNVLDRLVRRSLALVIDRNLQANADRYGRPQFGSHLERYLVDTLRRLAAANASWVPNRDKTRVWFGHEGMFLVWPQAAGDMQALLEAEQIPGIPKAPDTVLEVLLAAGVFERRDAEQATWTIRPPSAKGVLNAVKLTSSAILFTAADIAPLPLDATLVCRPDEPVRTAPGARSPPDLPTGAPLSFIESPSSDDAAVKAVASTPLEATGLPPVPSPECTLKAPMRLNPAVRDALSAVVQTLQGRATSSAACAVADGLFVPIQELERRGIQPAAALRALADVHMLVHANRDRPHMVSRDFGGVVTAGLVIDPRFIDGFDLAGFVLPVSTKS